ncbi:hypothetical protein JTB14_011257 [Gonioctena quinquepunctata]|nr:hypothetical protein JTB14_011257 [Gonioctena quinquepunctata]
MGKVETKLSSLRKLRQLPFDKTILLLHSFSRCDNTSAIYGKSEVRIAYSFTANHGLTHDISVTFTDPSTSPEDIEEKLLLAVYQSPAHQDNMNKHRYSAFLKASTKSKSDMATLPSTRGASKQPSLRVYL